MFDLSAERVRLTCPPAESRQSAYHPSQSVSQSAHLTTSAKLASRNDRSAA